MTAMNMTQVKDYSEFPPLKYLLRVLKNSPKSALLYIQLWNKKGESKKIITEKNNVRKEFLISPTMFRNLLVPLMFLNLIDFTESDEKFQINIWAPHLND